MVRNCFKTFGWMLASTALVISISVAQAQGVADEIKMEGFEVAPLPEEDDLQNITVQEIVDEPMVSEPKQPPMPLDDTIPVDVVAGPSATQETVISSGREDDIIDELDASAKRAGDDSFFDSEEMVPQGEMGKRGPIRVNPVYQPGQKLIFVDRTAKAGEKNSSIIAVDRALALGLDESAFELVEDLYQKSPKDAAILTRRAIALQKLGRFDEAMQTYEVLTEVDPGNINAKVNMLGLLSTRYPAVALRRLMELYKENKENVTLLGQLAIVSAKTGDTKMALRYLGMAATMDPKNASHFFNMAVIADREGDLRTAVQYYEKALEIDTIHGSSRSIPRASVYDRLAQIR